MDSSIRAFIRSLTYRQPSSLRKDIDIMLSTLEHQLFEESFCFHQEWRIKGVRKSLRRVLRTPPRRSLEPSATSYAKSSLGSNVKYENVLVDKSPIHANDHFRQASRTWFQIVATSAVYLRRQLQFFYF